MGTYVSTLAETFQPRLFRQPGGEECLKSIIATSEDRKLVAASVGDGYIRFNSRRDFSAETFQSVCGGVKRLRDKVGKTKPDGSNAGHPILF